MARQQLEILVDDIDGSEADETVLFALDGEAFEIDLNTTHAEALRALLAPYIEQGRKATPRRTRRKSAKSTTGGSNSTTPSAKVRAWAAENGMPVNSRGRIPADILAAYEAAHAS